MKKRDKSYRMIAGPVKLYLDDVVEIIDAMQELEPNGKLKIFIDEYELTSLEELTQVGQKFWQSLDISYTSPTYNWLNLSVEERSSEIRSTKTGLSVTGVFAKVESILVMRRLKWHWTYSFRQSGSVIAIVGAFLWSIASSSGLSSLLITSYGFMAFGLAILLVYVATRGQHKSRIALIDRHNESSFWTRNRDALAINAISALVGGIMGYLLAILSK